MARRGRSRKKASNRRVTRATTRKASPEPEVEEMDVSEMETQVVTSEMLEELSNDGQEKVALKPRRLKLNASKSAEADPPSVKSMDAENKPADLKLSRGKKRVKILKETNGSKQGKKSSVDQETVSKVAEEESTKQIDSKSASKVAEEESTKQTDSKSASELDVKSKSLLDSPVREELLDALELQIAPNSSRTSSSSPPPVHNSEVLKDSADETKSPDLTTVGKLRSAIADAEGTVLANSYRKCLKDMEEYSLNFLSVEVQHPVITCFRELTRSDIATIVSNGKLKKASTNLELSFLYLGLIDLMATTNNNPLYGENCNAKFSKNVSGIVQKILLEFKNIIGTWALSGKALFSNRAAVLLRYLRSIGSMFEKCDFDKEFFRILDSIESEITRHKSNQEKLKNMGTFSTPSTKSETSATNNAEDGERLALNEIVLNVSLNPKIDDSDDEDVVQVVDEKKPIEIFGKPLKTSSGGVKRKRVVKKKPPASSNDASKLSSSLESTKSPADKTETPKSNSTSNKKIKKSPKSASTRKRSATEELTKVAETLKKRKTDEALQKSPVPNLEKSSIKNFFQSSSSSSSPAESPNASISKEKSKPAVNAFALMMNKSRELAQKQKLNRMSKMGPPLAVVPALKMHAVKT